MPDTRQPPHDETSVEGAAGAAKDVARFPQSRVRPRTGGAPFRELGQSLLATRIGAPAEQAMPDRMHVSIAPAHRRIPGDSPKQSVAPLLAQAGPCAIRGGHLEADRLAVPIAASAYSLFGARGLCLAGDDGPLFFCDTGHHRLLIWTRMPNSDDAPADWLIGQPDFRSEGRNTKGDISATTLNVPTGVAADHGILAVADAWNHRVLIWHDYPHASHRGADVVIGQSDFASSLANRGADSARADTLHWCYGVTISAGRLFVADTGNRRVLVWDHIPTANGTPADIVLGQRDFATRDENSGQGGGALGMRWPHGIVLAAGKILVADAGNNRIMVWQTLPRSQGVPCDFVLGQADVFGIDPNRAAYDPTATALNMPYGLVAQQDRLIVADTANFRLLGFGMNDLAMGAAATRLAEQIDVTNKGDNCWGPQTRDLCWPYGGARSGNMVAIANTGNNRVLLFEAAA
jgi:hypothetical protein